MIFPRMKSKSGEAGEIECPNCIDLSNRLKWNNDYLLEIIEQIGDTGVMFDRTCLVVFHSSIRRYQTEARRYDREFSIFRRKNLNECPSFEKRRTSDALGLRGNKPCVRRRSLSNFAKENILIVSRKLGWFPCLSARSFIVLEEFSLRSSSVLPFISRVTFVYKCDRLVGSVRYRDVLRITRQSTV